MEIVPSIDLKSGLCVRLYQGDYGKQTVYSDAPIDVALRWEKEDACRLHLVDLDGAVTGEQTNLEVIKAIVGTVSIPIQVGGGIRSLDSAGRLLDMGVDRVVLGTAAIEAPDLVEQLCRDWGAGRIVVAVDARGGRVAIRGWTEGTAIMAYDLVKRMDDLGVARYLYTDISRDGTLTQPNFEATEELVRCTSRPIMASGGISSTEHVVRLAAIGVEGAIIGSALYTGEVGLDALLAAASAACD